MRAVIQRVRQASVRVGDEVAASLGAGLAVLLGVGRGDSEAEARWLADRIAHLRIFEDEAGRLNRSVLETGGEVLVVSQFTLYGDARRGRRPSFDQAAEASEARVLVDKFVDNLRALGVQTSTGVFGAHMVLALENEGPVTIILESRE